MLCSRKMTEYVGKTANLGSSSCTAVSGHMPSTGLIMYTYVEEVKLISLATDAVGEEEGISLQPRHRLGRILEANAGTAHDDSGDGWYLGDSQSI